MAPPDFTRICAAALQDWKAARHRVLKSGATRGAVHSLRIQMRRLLALEALLAPRGSALAAALHDIFHQSGRLRDAQLVAHAMRDFSRAIPEGARLAKHERRREPRLAQQLRRELRAMPVARLAPIVEGWLQPQRGDPQAMLARRAAGRLDARLKALTTAKSRNSTAAHSLHRRRIRLKELRYMAELAAAAGCALPQSLSLEALTEQQRMLGTVTDIDMQLHKVASFAAKHPGWRACAVELGRALRQQRARALQELASAATLSQRGKLAGSQIL